MHDHNDAFHEHLHNVIQMARSAADIEEPAKVPVRIKPATFLVAYYNENEPQVDGTIECDSLIEAQVIENDIKDENTKTRIFVDASLVLPENRLLTYQRDFAYVGEEIRKEQAQAQTDHEG